ncbi:MAG: hypothetical protein WBE37_12665 [Bryobacteraceae bacterium]
MDQPEKRAGIARQFIVAISQNLFVARRQIIRAGGNVPVENSLVDGLGNQGIAFLAFAPSGFGLQALSNVAAIPQQMSAISLLVQNRIKGDLQRIAQIGCGAIEAYWRPLRDGLGIKRAPALDLFGS